jgi:hypothetical protein
VAHAHVMGWFSARGGGYTHGRWQAASCCAPCQQAVCPGHHGRQQQRIGRLVDACFKRHLGGSMKRVAAGTSSSSGRRHGVGMNHADSGSSRSRAAEQGNWGKRKRRLQATGEENGSATSLVR